MEPRAKPAKARVATGPAVARQSRIDDDSRARGLEQRLAEALEQKAALSEVLTVISRSASDLQPVFDMVAERAVRLCAANKAFVYRLDGDVLRVAAAHGASPELMEFTARNPIAPGRHSGAARAALERQTVHIADVRADPEYTFGGARVDRIRTVLAVPILKRAQLLGVIVIYRPEVRPFTDVQVALMQAFADQAAIAIENVRLLSELQARNRDLTIALDEKTATGEILRVISSSQTDVQPVFDAIAATVLRLCDGRFSGIYRFDGELIHLAALANLGPEGEAIFRSVYPTPPGRGGATQRAILTRGIVHIPDIRADPEYVFHDAARMANFRSALSVPMLRDGNPIGTITVYRDVARAFPDSQIELLRTFADQAVIAIENVRLFKELGTRNVELTEALEHQTATSEILRVISRSPTDVQPVFDTIATAALRLCGATSANVFTFDGNLIHVGSIVNVNPAAAEAMRCLWPRPPGRDMAAARVVLTGSVLVIPDVLDDPGYPAASIAIAGGFRSILGVPLLRDGNPIGAITIGRPEPGPFPDAQVALLQIFADQAVIAIENVRLFTELQARNRDLTTALDQKTATGEILRVISSAQTDVQPVFDAIVRSAVRLCNADHSLAASFDGELLHPLAYHGFTPEALAILARKFPMRPSRENMLGRTALKRAVENLPDMLADPDYSREFAAAGGWRSGLGVPMLRDGQLIGAIAVSRREPGAFPDHLVELLKTFADQAVIAVENVRLFKALESRNRDLTEALEQQTATSEILRVISQSQTNVQPVFESIATAALELCRARSALVTTFDGELIHLAATANVNAEGADAIRHTYPRPPDRSSANSRAILTSGVVAISDVLDDTEYAVRNAALASGFRSVVAVPLLRDGGAIGAISVGRPEPGPFSDKQIALLRTFADQAVIAIENVRLFTELEARTRDLTRSVGELKALGEVGQAVSSTLDLETVLSTIVSRATQLAGMDGGAIHEYDEASAVFHLHTTHRLPDEVVAVLRATHIRKGEGAVGKLAVTGEPVEIRDIMDTDVYQSRVRDVIIQSGFRSLLAVPLLREDHLLGGLVVCRNSPGAFAPEVIDLLKTFATQSALAIQNARLFREIGDKSRQLETASRHKSEFLANMSHELRTPLNAIIGFSEVLSERMFGEINDKQAEYLGDILESGRHLLSLINDILDLSKIEAGRMELEPTDFDLAGAIENTLVLVRERAHRRGIALTRAIDGRLGMIHADERKVKQVLLNLLSNALKFTPEGGRIAIAAEVRDGAIEISVTDTGVGIAAQDQAAVFEEFRQVGAAARKVEGTGLGLAISRKFIELHGGRIGVKSVVGTGSTFAFTLPLPEGRRSLSG